MGVGHLGHDFRPGIGHRKDDRVRGHPLHVLHVDDVRHAQPNEHVGALHHFRQGVPVHRRIRHVGVARLRGVQVVSIGGDRPITVDPHDVLDAHLQEHFRDGGARSPDPHRHNPNLLQVLLHDLQRVEQGGRRDHRRPMLIVVEDRNVELFLQSLLDGKAARGGNVFQVDAAKHRGNAADRFDNLLHVGRIEANRKPIHPRKFLQELRLALHHGNRSARPDVTKPQDRRAVGHNRDGVAFDCQPMGVFGRVVDRLGHPGHARGVRHRQLIAGPEGGLALDLQLPTEVHEKGPIRHVHHVHPVQVSERLHDGLCVIVAPGVDRDVAGQFVLLGPDNVDRPDVASVLPDHGRDVREHARAVVNHDPYGDGVAGGWEVLFALFHEMRGRLKGGSYRRQEHEYAGILPAHKEKRTAPRMEAVPGSPRMNSEKADRG